MSERGRAQALLHGVSCAAIIFLLVANAEQALPGALHPLTAPGRSLLLLLALVAPSLPLRGITRATWFTAGLGAATVLAPLGQSALAAATGLAAGSLWLSLLPRFVSPRALAAGAALGVALLPLHAWLPQGSTRHLLAAAAAALLAVVAFASPWSPPRQVERRGRGLRLRGMAALGGLLYLDFLLRRQLLGGDPERTAAAVLVGAAAAVLVMFASAPQPRERRPLLALALLAAASITAAAVFPLAAFWLIALRGVVVLLVARALVTAAARRHRFIVSMAWLAWLAAAAAGALAGTAAALAAAGALAVCMLALLPRPARWSELAA